jgi:hypothetical protein
MWFRKYSSTVIAALALAVGRTPALAENARLTVTEDLSHAGDMEACVLAAADAANAENLDGFLEHFTSGTQRKLRRKTAMVFVQGDFGLEILDCHVVETAENRGEVALRYRVSISERQMEIVATLAMRREDGYWKISSEKVTRTLNYGASCSPSRSSYLGGGEIAMR